MTPGLAATCGDAIAVMVALWFIAGTSFADISAKPLLDAVAAAAIVISLRRIWRRHRGRA